MIGFIITIYLFLGILSLITSLIVVSPTGFGQPNPVSRLSFLIIVYQAGSFMYTILDFYFLGLTYIIVYVGAIAILFLFVIMMIPVGRPISYEDASAWPRVFRGFLSILQVTTQVIVQIGSSEAFSEVSGTYDQEIIINNPIFNGHPVVSYFYPSWTTEFRTITDIQTQAYTVYVAYPVALIQIGIALWATLIGIIAVTSRLSSTQRTEQPQRSQSQRSKKLQLASHLC